MAHITEAERADICTVLQICRRRGYGNILSHVKAAWIVREMVAYGCLRDEAIREIQDREPMNLEMHLDIVQLGWWDETGARYMDKRFLDKGFVKDPEADNAPE